MLISSNRLIEEWNEVFGDQVGGAAILDRLLHHSHVVGIRGDSHRLSYENLNNGRVTSSSCYPSCHGQQSQSHSSVNGRGCSRVSIVAPQSNEVIETRVIFDLFNKFLIRERKADFDDHSTQRHVKWLSRAS